MTLWYSRTHLIFFIYNSKVQILFLFYETFNNSVIWEIKKDRQYYVGIWEVSCSLKKNVFWL